MTTFAAPPNTVPPATVPDAPGGLPLLGHIPHIAQNPLAFFMGLQKVGPVVRVRIATHTSYVVNSPELARRLHTTDQDLFDKGGPVFDRVRPYVGNGLASCPAHDHARQRPAMQPAFQRGRIERYAEVMTATADEVTSSWRPGQTLDLYKEMHRLTTLVIGRTLISADQADPAARHIAQAVPDIMRGVYWRMIIPSRVFASLPIPVNRRYEEVTAHTRKVVDKVVDHYLADGSDYGDLLSMVVAACKDEPDPHSAVYDQVVTFLTAGLESVASSLTHTLRLLYRNPEVLGRLRAELQEVLGGGAGEEPRLPGYDDMPRLRYTQNVITEGLRLYPPAWISSRVATEDIPWEQGGIPAGAGVFFSPYALHRDPSVFAAPDAFDPDRWSTERVTNVQRQGYFALGAGRRKCIGDVFGTVEATIALATILTRWRLLHPASSADAKPTVTALLLPPRTLVRVERNR
ncbi:cytochrome P450 [Streptomyces sp. NPDC091280]|uniref:cytochrome P450 n=1 Tax=Streptomyces sp. NPDC091280 TaxID=3365984 RepID=UPI0037FBF243